MFALNKLRYLALKRGQKETTLLAEKMLSSFEHHQEKERFTQELFSFFSKDEDFLMAWASKKICLFPKETEFFLRDLL